MATVALGPRPTLSWIDKSLLRIESSYQRTLSAKRSQRLIEKLAANFCWAHCAPLIAAVGYRGTYTLIDGQHRHQAALRRDDIKDLPCYVVDAKDLKAQVEAFVAHNRDRVALNSVVLFHAAVAAGEPAAAGVVAACQEAGVEVHRTPMSVDRMAPHQTIATGACTRIVTEEGRARLVEVLKIIRAAHPTTPGQMRSHTITAVAALLRLQLATRPRIVKAIAGVSGQDLETKARLRAGDGVSIPDAYVAVLGELCGADFNETMKKLAAERKAKAAAKTAAFYAARRKAKESKRGRPFRFDRSRPSKAKAAPIEIRGNVKVRRFEAGTWEQILVKTFAAIGGRVEPVDGGHRVRKYRYRGKLYSRAEILERANKIRAERGLEPLGPGA